jgi:uncharacterized protein
MAITYDPAESRPNLARTRARFQGRAEEAFAGRVYQQRDDRRDYGEARLIIIGFLRSRMVVLVWTPRGGDKHVISMRKANDREKARYRRYFEDDR